MSYFIGTICLFFILISLLVDKRIYSPTVLFNFWWGVTIFVSGFGFFGIYVPSDKTYLVMLVTILAFNFPFLCSLLVPRKNKKNFFAPKNVDTFDIYYKDNKVEKLLLILQMFCIVFLINLSITVLNMLLSGFNYENIRYAFFYEDTIMSGYEHLIYNLIVTPIIYFNMIYVSLKFLKGKYNKLLLVLTILSVGLSSFSSGSRGIVLEMGLVFILSYFLQGKKVKFNISNNFKVISIFIIVVSSLVYITISRSGSDNTTLEDIIETVVLYFSAPYIYFEKLSSYALNDNVLLFGATFFGGIIDILLLVFNFIGLDVKTVSSYIANHNQLFLTVGNGHTYNAFPTMVYTFLYDFNYLGVIIGPTIFGLLTIISYKKMLITNRIAYKGIYIVIALMIYESPMKWEGTSANPWLVIIMFLIYDYFFAHKIRISTFNTVTKT